MQRLRASGAEQLLDALLQTMAANRDLDPDEMREVPPGFSILAAADFPSTSG